MLEYKFLYIFLLLVRFIYSEVVRENISDWDTFINKNDINKSNEYIYTLDKTVKISSDPGNFLNKYEKITIIGNGTIKKRIKCNNNDIPSVFKFSSDNKLSFKLENIEVISCAVPFIEMQGSNVDIEIKDCNFSQSNSIVQAVSVNSVKITGCEFK